MVFSTRASLVRATLAAAWLICAAVVAFRDWDPLRLHYLTLFFRETPLFFPDIVAAFQKLFADGLRQTGYLLLLLLAAAGGGRLALIRCRCRLTLSVRSIIAVALGLVLLSYMTLLLGMLQLYSAVGARIAWLVLGLCAGAALRPLCQMPAAFKRAVFSWTDACLLCCALIWAVFLLSKALWPAVHVDAITYHLGIPNYYLQEGGLQYIPTDMYSAFPFFTEMLYVLAMLVEGQKSAQFTSVLFFFLSVVCVYAFMSSFVGKRCARIAASLFTVTPCFMDASLLAGNDIALVFFVLMAVFCFFLWRRHDRSVGMLVLTGIFAGVCLSIKYTALTFMPPLFAAGLIGDALQRRERPGARLFRRGAICACAAVAVFLPWCIRNFMNTGNPIYPALYPVLGGADMSGEMYGVIKQFASAFNLESLLVAAAYRLQAVFHFAPRFFQTTGPLGNVGLALLFFFPLLPALRRTPYVIKTLCWGAAVLFLSWAMFSNNIRFFYPGIAVLLLLAAYAAAAATEQFPLVLKPFFVLAAAVCVLLNCGMGMYQVNMRTKTYGTDFLHDSDERYLRRHMISNRQALLDSYPANCYINENSRADARILIIGDAQHLYLRRRHLYTYLSATTPYEPFRKCIGDCRQTWRELKRRGITHIQYNPFELRRLQGMGCIAWKREDNYLFELFFKSPYVRRVYYSRRQVIEVMVFELR